MWLGVLCATASPIYGGLAQRPVARMTSTSSMISSSANYMSSPMQVRGIQTSATYVTGGITSGDTYARIAGIRNNGGIIPPENPDQCYCVDEDGNGICDHCGAELDEFDGGCSNDPCWCPLSFDWKALIFLTALAGAYALKKVRASKKKSEAC